MVPVVALSLLLVVAAQSLGAAASTDSAFLPPADIDTTISAVVNAGSTMQELDTTMQHLESRKTSERGAQEQTAMPEVVPQFVCPFGCTLVNCGRDNSENPFCHNLGYPNCECKSFPP
mmetsp:Transcript_27879/g.89805  ORF Transcript_27879/g.89805 Transcript_27879/m.89805 type:complete len:118 (+) Transcript_27879:149-502(+)